MAGFFALLFWLAVGLVFYHLLGYPLLLALLARFFKNPVRRGEYLPPVSVIIAAYNEGGVIREKILSILQSDYPAERIEIIVAEDGSTDGTVEQVRSVADPRVVLDHSPLRGGKMAAINRAVGRAQGEIFVFTDANAVLLPDTLRCLLSNFADPAVGCACGRKALRGSSDLEASENAYWRYESWIKVQESRLGSTPAAQGELQAVRRSVFAAPAGSTINDDFQLVLNTVVQGSRAVYDPRARTVENGSASMGDEYGRKSRISAGRWQVLGQVFRLAFKHPGFVGAFISHKLLRLLVFGLMLLALIGNLGAVLLNPPAAGGLGSFFQLAAPWGAVFLGLQGLFYACAALGFGLDRLGLRVKALYFIYFFMNAQAASMSGWFRFSSGRQTVAWRKVAR